HAPSWGRSTQFAVKTTTKKSANATVGNSISRWGGSSSERRRAPGSAAGEVGRAALGEARDALGEILALEEQHRLQQHVVAVALEVLGEAVPEQALHGLHRERGVPGDRVGPLAGDGGEL